MPKANWSNILANEWKSIYPKAFHIQKPSCLFYIWQSLAAYSSKIKTVTDHNFSFQFLSVSAERKWKLLDGNKHMMNSHDWIRNIFFVCVCSIRTLKIKHIICSFSFVQVQQIPLQKIHFYIFRVPFIVISFHLYSSNLFEWIHRISITKNMHDISSYNV